MNPDLSAILATVSGVAVRTSNDYFPAAGGDLPLLEIKNDLGTAVLALQGAHVLSFIPAGESDLLWVSPKAQFVSGKAVRGGIPLCMPWFGGHPDGLPSHGFARNSDWTLQAAEHCADGTTKVTLSMRDSEASRKVWPHAFHFELQIQVGRELVLKLTTHNTGDTAIPYTYAFHTYFAVEDYTRIAVQGLAGCTYIDTLGEVRRLQQVGDLTFSGTTDRVYLDVPSEQIIVDSARKIKIQSNSQSAVVWNPGEHAAKMSDVTLAHHKGFICVERGDVFDNALSLAPGEQYTAQMTLSL